MALTKIAECKPPMLKAAPREKFLRDTFEIWASVLLGC
jgi:hypothetical protein